MNRLRWKLLGAMLAVVVVTAALSALFSRRITHEEFRKILVAQQPADVQSLADHYRLHRGWKGVEAALDQIPARIILTTPERKVIAVSRDLRTSSVTVGANDRVSIVGRGSRLVFQLPPARVGDAYAYVLPKRGPIHDAGAFDRRLIVTFAAAALTASLLALFVARRITGPVERLTAAVDAMANGALPTQVAVSGRDEIAQLAQSFNAMADALARQSDLRRRMVGDVAHELRTPLTNLRCELESIQDGLIPLDTARVTSIHEEVLHLGRLVDDLQELAVADAGGVRLRRERVDLAAAVSRVVQAFASSRRIEVSTEEVFVFVDPVRIGQIVRNLLTNAIRHARETIRVTVSRHDGQAVLSVADDGPGIPPEQLSQVFERFYRVDDGRSRDDGGSGLGLAIVRQLVELHGGRVRAENAPGGGAVFIVALPS